MKKERKIVVKLIEKDNIHNHRLVEFFARRISERGIGQS